MEKKVRTQGTTSKRAKNFSYKLPGYKFSAEDEKYLLFILLVTFKEKDVEREKTKILEIFSKSEIRHGINQKPRISKGLKM